jgi:hypothetical protein
MAPTHSLAPPARAGVVGDRVHIIPVLVRDAVLGGILAYYASILYTMVILSKNKPIRSTANISMVNAFRIHNTRSGWVSAQTTLTATWGEFVPLRREAATYGHPSATSASGSARTSGGAAIVSKRSGSLPLTVRWQTPLPTRRA